MCGLCASEREKVSLKDRAFNCYTQIEETECQK